MLRFNSFRSKRYLRTRFVEGNFLLASEGSDLELEILDLLRTSVKNTVGDVAIGDAWEVERLSDTSVLIKPGEAWFRGLPFIQRFGKDQLVTGAILSLGTTPVGVTATDHPDGLGKIINFNDSATTPTNTYRFVISATEELVTATDDPFLQNANLTETTAQKVRLNYRINIVPASLQDNSPVPYRDEDSTSTSTTNFPDSGGSSSPNFVNDIVITPTSGGDGEQLNLTNVTGSEQIDGRDLEITVRNASSTFPSTSSEQRKFSNGKLIDSNGSEFHINQIFTGNVSTEIVLRIDKEPDQPNPEIVNTKPYTLIKRDVYTTDDANGVPQGRLHWAIADLEWDSVDLINHSSKVTNLRNVIQEDEEFQDRTNKKDNIFVVGGGNINWDASTNLLTWAADIKIKNPFSPVQTVSTGSSALISDGFLVYEQDLESGGIISKGQLALTVATAGSTSMLSGSPDLSQIRIGNIVIDSGGTIAEITAVDDTNDTITTSPALAVTGTANVYLDSFSANTAPLSSNSITLASREGSKAYLGLNDLELEDGETSQLGDGLSQELLQLFGTGITETTSAANYSSNIRGTTGEGFQERLGVLTDAEGDNQEDRSAYIRSAEEVTWTGTQLEFSSDIVLDIINTKDGTTTTHTIEASNSPIALNDGESLYVNIDRTISEIVSPILSDTTPIPAQTQADKDIFVLFKRIGSTITPTPTTVEQTSIIENPLIGVNASQYMGQTFTTSDAMTVSSIDVKLRKSSGSTGTVTLEIWGTDGSGLPDSSNVIAASPDVLDISTLPVSPGVATETFNFSSPSLSSSTTYAFVFITDNITAGTLRLLGDDTNPYAGGVAVFAANPGTTGTWTTDPTDDAYFIVAGETIPAPGKSNLHLPFTKQVIVEGQTSFLGASGTGAGSIKSTFLDPLSTSLPTGSTVTIDGVSGQNGDTVLFTNLSVDNNKIYELNGVGSSITWTPVLAFSGQDSPTDGDSVRILKGDSFQEQLAVFDSVEFKVNDVIRLFDGVSANFWELGSIKTVTLTDNTTDNVFTVTASGSENFVIPYSIVRGLNKETGEIFLTSDGTNVTVTKSSTFIGDPGVEFDGDILTGDLRLRYTTTSTGSNATMKLFTKRWSDAAGGPTGVPSYSGATSSTITAAGNTGDVQYKDSGGSLAGDTRFKWDDSEGALNLDGLQYKVLQGPVTLLDNQTNATAFSYNSSNKYSIIEYSILRNSSTQVGRLLVTTNGSSVSLSDDNTIVGSPGVTWSAAISGSDVLIQYSTTSTGFDADFKYIIRRWM